MIMMTIWLLDEFQQSFIRMLTVVKVFRKMLK
jgi:hypothetical protein